MTDKTPELNPFTGQWEVECETCTGFGSVVVDVVDEDGEECEELHTCPTCGGFGSVSFEEEDVDWDYNWDFMRR